MSKHPFVTGCSTHLAQEQVSWKVLLQHQKLVCAAEAVVAAAAEGLVAEAAAMELAGADSDVQGCFAGSLTDLCSLECLQQWSHK